MFQIKYGDGDGETLDAEQTRPVGGPSLLHIGPAQGGVGQLTHAQPAADQAPAPRHCKTKTSATAWSARQGQDIDYTDTADSSSDDRRSLPQMCTRQRQDEGTPRAAQDEGQCSD